MRMSLLFLIICFGITGCASVSNIVPAGKDVYLVTASDPGIGVAGASLKLKLYERASKYCNKQNKKFEPVTENATDYQVFRGLANADLKFRCE